MRVAQLPQMRYRRPVADQAARAVAQHGLFFGQDEGHGISWLEVLHFSVIAGLYTAIHLLRKTLNKRDGCAGQARMTSMVGGPIAVTPPAGRGCVWRRYRASPRKCRLRSSWPWCAARRADARRHWSARFP